MINAPEFIYFVVFIAFLFDFLNGLHDAPNSIVTIVVTRVLKPFPAVLWAAFFNFIAFLFFKLNVANTIGAGLIIPNVVTPYLLFCALFGSINWNLITWYFGLPSSSSHALIGGIVGATLATAGWSALNFQGLLPVLLALIISPTLGLVTSIILIRVTKFLNKKLTHETIDIENASWVKITQFIASAFLSLGHGGNDAQKTMGLIAVLLYSGGLLGDTFYIPFWVVMSCNLVMGLGTLFGGWRIVHTMGEKITSLTPLTGSCVAASAAMTLLTANECGLPISTTHTVTGAIIGSGLSKGRQHIYWSTVYQIIWSWLLTIPCAACLAGGTMYAGQLLQLV
jgi:inorganic phosphate transporter, PiT family